MERNQPLWIVTFSIMTATGIATVCYISGGGHPESHAICHGTFESPSNLAYYRNNHADPLIENYYSVGRTLRAEMPNLYNRFQTIIFDCPVTVSSRYSKYSVYHYVFLRALAKFNKYIRPPMAFWLRLDKRPGTNDNISLCTDLAVLGNQLFPGSVKGVLGNSEILSLYAAANASNAIEQNATFYNENITNQSSSSPCKSYSEQCIEHLNSQGLKFGLMLSPVDCPVLAKFVPSSITSKFDEIFYFEGERTKITVGKDKLQILTVSDDFKECRKLIAEMVAGAETVKYAITENREIHALRKLPPYPFCLESE